MFLDVKDLAVRKVRIHKTYARAASITASVK